MASITLESLQLTNEKNIKQWLDRFEALCVLTNVDEMKKATALIAYLGSTAYNTLVENVAPKHPSEYPYQELKKILLGYKSTELLVAVARYQFSKIEQKLEEDVLELYNRLNAAAIGCKFDKSKDERIRDQLVTSLRNKRQIEAVLQVKNEEYLKLKSKELMQRIQSIEVISLGVTQMSEEKVTIQANNVQPYREEKGKIYNCFTCGGSHERRSCPAYGKKCAFCGVIGHFAKVCRKKSGSWKKENSTIRPKNHNFKQRSYQPAMKYQGKGRVTNYIKEESESSVSVLSVQHKPGLMQTFPVLINGKEVRMVLDTGAQVSVIRDDVAREIGLQVSKSKKTLYSYDGNNLNVIGSSKVNLEWQGQIRNSEIYVVHSTSNHDGLLGQDILNLFNKKVVINSIDAASGIKNITVDIGLKEGCHPIFLKSRPIALGLRRAVKEEIERLQSLQVIEKVEHSEWGTPIVAIKKQNGKIRLCCDYKVTLNPLIADVGTPTLNVEDLLSEIGEAKVFSKLDLEGAYLQLKLDKDSKKLTTMNTPWGLYQFNRLPFGIKSAPSIFQTAMLKITSGLSGILVYLDDVLIYGDSKKQHDDRLKALKKRFEEYNVKLNAEKCKYSVQKIKFLGHILSENGIEPNKELISGIVDAPYPENRQQLQSLIGSVQYYSKFIKGLAHILSPLTDLLKTKSSWNFGKQQINAVDEIKRCLTQDLVLKPFSLSSCSQLKCDASPTGLGAVLQQNGHPVIYISRKLTPTEQGYSQTDREALAIIWAVKRLHKFIFGHHFEIVTDHRALKYIFDSHKSVSVVQAARLQRWALTLSAYDYTIINRPASDLVVADYLSRYAMASSAEGTPTQINFNEGITALAKKAMFKQIMNTSTYQSLKRYIQEGVQEEIPIEFRKFKSIINNMTVQEDYIYVEDKLFVPEEFVPYVLNQLHETHLGIVATKRLARNHYFWFGMSKTIEDKIRSCQYCNRFKDRYSKKTELSPWPVSKYPWEKVHVDFCEINGKYLFVLVDSYTKFPEVVITKDMSAETVKTVLQSIFSRFGIPQCLVSDNGPAFISISLQNWLRNIGCRQLTIAPYHPQSNGLAERFVRTIKQQLKETGGEELQNTINKFLFCYRNTQHNTTGFTPTELMFNRKIRTSHTVFCEPKEAWIFDPLKKQYGMAEVIGDLGNVMKVVRKEDGTITKRHLDQIKFNPTSDQFNNLRRSTRIRKQPDRYGINYKVEE